MVRPTATSSRWIVCHASNLHCYSRFKFKLRHPLVYCTSRIVAYVHSGTFRLVEVKKYSSSLFCLLSFVCRLSPLKTSKRTQSGICSTVDRLQQTKTTKAFPFGKVARNMSSSSKLHDFCNCIKVTVRSEFNKNDEAYCLFSCRWLSF